MLDRKGECVEHSPIWVRPISFGDSNIYNSTDVFQIVGHSKVKTVTEDGNAIFVDCLGTTTQSKQITLE